MKQWLTIVSLFIVGAFAVTAWGEFCFHISSGEWWGAALFIGVGGGIIIASIHKWINQP